MTEEKAVKGRQIRMPLLNRPGLSTFNNLVFGPAAAPVIIGLLLGIRFYFKEKDNFKDFPAEGKSPFN